LFLFCYCCTFFCLFMILFFFFFFSSRRRHTRWPRDWSSDVCSSDLSEAEHRLGLHYRWTPEGVPVLEDTVVQLSCTVVATHLAGDHTIIVARVEDAEIPGGEPLLFFRGEYRQVAGQ